MANTQNGKIRKTDECPILQDLWWDIDILHEMNKVRIPFICEGLRRVGAIKENLNVANILQGLNVLDVGCGGGLLSEPLARLGCTITGVDACENAITVAKEHATLDPKLNNLQYEYSNIEDYANDNAEKYDVVIASEVVEHAADYKLFLEACVKCLKPGGSIFITTFNKTTTSWLVGIILLEYIYGIIPKGHHQWDIFIPPSDMQRTFEQYNCKIVPTDITGLWYSVLTRKWSLTSNDNLSYAMHAVKST